MTVYCDADSCRYNKNYECYRGTIYLDSDGECQEFENLYDDPEWQKPYWKRTIDRDTNQVYRVLSHGKGIEIKGVKFFVDINNDYATATEETTGLSCGSKCDLEERIDKIIESVAKVTLPPLETLPIGEYDNKTGKVKPKQEEQKDENN